MAYWKTDKRQTIKTNLPISKGIPGEFYFELLVIDSGKKDHVAIGVCRENYPVDEYPGSEDLSIGYWSYKGRIYVESNRETYTDKVISSGNVIGVLLDYSTATLTFTRDKEEVHKVELKPNFEKEALYPCVGIEYGGSVRLLTSKQGM